MPPSPTTIASYRSLMFPHSSRQRSPRPLAALLLRPRSSPTLPHSGPAPQRPTAARGDGLPCPRELADRTGLRLGLPAPAAPEPAAQAGGRGAGRLVGGEPGRADRPAALRQPGLRPPVIRHADRFGSSRRLRDHRPEQLAEQSGNRLRRGGPGRLAVAGRRRPDQLRRPLLRAGTGVLRPDAVLGGAP